MLTQEREEALDRPQFQPDGLGGVFPLFSQDDNVLTELLFPDALMNDRIYAVSSNR